MRGPSWRLIGSLAVLLSTTVLGDDTTASTGPAPLTQFSPGDLWPDDKGVPINAHGGGILLDQGTYYWYGEHKVAGGAGNYAQVGVHVYSSTNLYNWRDRGIALAVSNDSRSDIAKGCILERPKVIHNPRTGKYVMWFHLELKDKGYSAARAGVAVADTPVGPFTFLRSGRLNPGVLPQNPMGANSHLGFPANHNDELLKNYPDGQMLRDMNLYVDDDGSAYVVYASEDNNVMQIAQLSDDFLSPSGKYSEVLSNQSEAPALFKHDGKYWLVTSGCSGWAPNEARLAVASSIWGPYESLTDPCHGRNPDNQLGPEKTFGGQSTFVLPVPGQPDAFIAMFDVWNPGNAIDGRYLWLPLRFVDGKPNIEFRKHWSLTDFSAAPGG